MKRLLFILLCLGIVGTYAGCYLDPASGMSTSVGVSVGAYEEDVPYWSAYPYEYYWDTYPHYGRWHHRWDRWHP